VQALAVAVEYRASFRDENLMQESYLCAAKLLFVTVNYTKNDIYELDNLIFIPILNNFFIDFSGQICENPLLARN